MSEQSKTELLHASIEEELGGFRHFADLPATEIEAMATRLVRLVADFAAPGAAPESRAA
jgi:hypothetical protein